MSGPNELPWLDEYVDGLRRYVERPSEEGLGEAYELGRQALRERASLMDLVGVHGEAWRRVAPGDAAEREVFQRFFIEAAAAFEITQRGYVEAQQQVADERARAELLRRLTQAYLAVAEAGTADERCVAAARQVEHLLGVDSARVELTTRESPEDENEASVLTAALPGGRGRLVAVGPAGRVWSESDQAVLGQLAVLVHDPIVEARLRELSERLERVGALLGQETDAQGIVARLLEDGLEQTGAGQGVILLPDAAGLRVVGARTSGAWVVGDVEPMTLETPIAIAARTGTPVFLADDAAIRAWADDHRLPAPSVSSQAWAIVPLRPGGVLELRFDGPQSFDPAQRSFLTQIGDRLGTALERGRAFAAEHQARRLAEAAVARVAQLRHLAADLSRATTQRSVASSALQHVIGMTGAAGALVAVPGERGDHVVVLDAVGAGGRSVAAEVSVVVDRVLDRLDPDDDTRLATMPARVRRALRAEGAATIGVYPLAASVGRAGQLLVWWSRSAPAFDRQQLDAAVSLLGSALERAGRYDTDHDISLTLQRSLLTVPTADIPGVEWAARYRSGSRGVAGGDWYDVIALDGGRVAVAIGDIVGKGVSAAAAMGQLRSASRALARRIGDPSKLLEALDDYAVSTGPGLYSSAAVVVLDPASGVAEHAAAGHPPLVLRSAGRAVAISTGRGPLLGVEGARTTATLRLVPGDMIVLYTDGLVERRDRSFDSRLDELCRAVEAGSTEPARLCQDLLDACVSDGATDDIAVVVVKMVGDGSDR